MEQSVEAVHSTNTASLNVWCDIMEGCLTLQYSMKEGKGSGNSREVGLRWCVPCTAPHSDTLELPLWDPSNILVKWYPGNPPNQTWDGGEWSLKGTLSWLMLLPSLNTISISWICHWYHLKGKKDSPSCFIVLSNPTDFAGTCKIKLGSSARHVLGNWKKRVSLQLGFCSSSSPVLLLQNRTYQKITFSRPGKPVCSADPVLSGRIWMSQEMKCFDEEAHHCSFPGGTLPLR